MTDTRTIRPFFKELAMSIIDPLIGSQLGDYHIVNLLGRGGMARVYRGYDERLDRYAAVKVIDAQLANESEGEYRQRFLREARAIAKLNHPNIVGVYQFGEVDSVYYMAMAFVQGHDLSHILHEYGRRGRLLAYRDILRVARDIASALDHAHAGGVIHRDVKPSNILVAVDGRAVLTDFGLALTTREGSLGNTFGSAHYIAPEQALSSASVVPQSDLYSLGVVLYQLLAGRVPFEDPSATAVALMHLNDAPPPPRLLNPSIPREVEAVVLRMLEKDPARRYKSGKAMLRALERAFVALPRDEKRTYPGQLVLAVPQGSSPTRSTISGRPYALAAPAARDRRGAVLVALGVLLLVAGAALVLVLVSGGDQRQAETGIGLLLGGMVSPTEPEPTPSSVPAALPATSSPVVVSAGLEPSQLPSRALTTATPGVTASELPSPTYAATATQTLAPSRTQAPSATLTVIVPEPTRTPAGDFVELHYDGDSLVVHNPSDRAVDVSNLQFVQSIDGKPPLLFRSNVWRDPARLESNACFQVWTDRFINLRAPEICHERQSWQAVSFVRWFWLSDQPMAAFEVRRGNVVLARCSVLAGRCTVRLVDSTTG